MLVQIKAMGYDQNSEKEFGQGNFIHILWQAFDRDFQQNGYRVIDKYSDYGVADNVHQILGVSSKFVNDKTNQYFFHVHPIYPAEQSQTGGWRWHKWGEYIGSYESEFDYIYDDYYTDEDSLKKYFEENLMEKHCVLLYNFIEVEPLQSFSPMIE